MWLILAASLIEAPDPPVWILPTWMAGCWEQVSGTSWTEECWTAPRGGMMMGSSRTGHGHRLSSFEQMRIESDLDGPSFCARPNDDDTETCFAKTQESETQIVFVNASHDYPQRIRYWREGRELLAETSLADGSKAQRWRYAPMGD